MSDPSVSDRRCSLNSEHWHSNLQSCSLDREFGEVCLFTLDDGHTETESMALVVQVDDPSLRIDGEERSHPHRNEAKPNLNVVVTIDLKELRRYTGDDGVVRCERYRSCKEYEAHFLLEDDDESQKRILNLDRVPLR